MTQQKSISTPDSAHSVKRRDVPLLAAVLRNRSPAPDGHDAKQSIRGRRRARARGLACLARKPLVASPCCAARRRLQMPHHTPARRCSDFRPRHGRTRGHRVPVAFGPARPNSKARQRAQRLKPSADWSGPTTGGRARSRTALRSPGASAFRVQTYVYSSFGQRHGPPAGSSLHQHTAG